MAIKHATLREAQLAIMEELSYIQRAETPELSYRILRERDVVAAVRPLMVKHGVTMRPIKSEFVHHGERQTSRGGVMLFVRAVRTFRFEHVGGEDFHDVEVLTEAMDSGDKASGKANTYAKKYCVFEWLCLEAGNDPDEVVAQRDTPNSEIFQRAWQAILASSSEESVEKAIQGILKDDYAKWTIDQKEELVALAHRRKVAFASGSIQPIQSKGGF